MNLYFHQKFIINKLNEHEKSYISWAPSMGATYAICNYLFKYLNTNFEKDVYVFSNTYQQKKQTINELLNVFDYYNSLNIIKDVNSNKISFTNYNLVKFFQYVSNIEYSFYSVKPDIVIFDNIRGWKNNHLYVIEKFIYNTRPKVIIIDNIINEVFLDIFDRNDEYYINIIPNFYSLNYKEYYKNLKIQLSYKDPSMYDFLDKKLERKEKLKNIILNNYD